MLPSRIPNRYKKIIIKPNGDGSANKKRRKEFEDQTVCIERDLTILIAQIINDGTDDEEQSLILLRHALKKIQAATKHLR